MLTRRHMISTIGGIGFAVANERSAWATGRLIPIPAEFRPIPIAIPPFVTGTAADDEVAIGIVRIVTDNLKRSGLFAPIGPSAFVEHISDFDRGPEFASWKQIRAESLVTGRATHQDDGRLKIEFRLWDTISGQELAGQQYVLSPDDWPRVAHIISDQIYTRQIGEKGYFDSRVVFVDESGPAEQRIRRLALMDQDGGNLRYLTSGAKAVRGPSFLLSSQKIVYTEFGQGDPEVYLLDIETGQREIVGSFPGMLFPPRFSPDGKRMVMSLVQDSDAHLFAIDLESRLSSRLTDEPAINTSPSYSPDGSQLCFESDRGGKPQIYVMPAHGGQAQRISFGGGSYSAPVWSRRGDYIAFVKWSGGESAVGIIRPDGSGERILAAGFHNGGPTFAPNGRVLMFVRDHGGDAGPSLYSVDISGRNERRVPTPGAASDPAWSPLLG